MAGKRVAVLDPQGKFATVDESDLENLPEGARPLTAKEEAAQRTEEAFQAQPLWKTAATIASMAGPVGYIPHAILRAQGAVLPPELEALQQGVSEGFTGGLASVGMKELVGAVGGKQAATAYGKTAEDVKVAHGGLYTAGQLAGFLGGAEAAPIGRIGGLAGSATRGLVGTGTSALARAGATAAELGVRGGVEGALYGAAGQISDDILGDRDLAADKIFAASGIGALAGGIGGAVLGGATSLAGSGLRAAATSVRGGLARVAAKAEPVAAKAEAAAVDAEAKAEAAGAAGAATAQEAKSTSAAQKLFAGQGNEAARQAANDLAFNALGTTRKVADKIGRDVKGGTTAVGDYVNRRILNVAGEDASLLGAIKGGRADDLMPLIEADRATIGSQIGDLIKANPVRVPMEDISKPGLRILDEMSKDPARIGAAGLLQKKMSELSEALANRGAIAADKTADLGELYYARAGMEKASRELGQQGQHAAKDAVNEWLREVDSTLVNHLDEAAKKTGAGVKDQLLGLKREYQLSSAALKAAEDGVNRLQGNNVFGLREGAGAMVGLATGHPLAALAAGIGGKVMRERGSAAGAYLLSKLADMGTVTKVLRAVDDHVGRAAKGLLGAPPKMAAAEVPAGTVRARAQGIMDQVSAYQANPQAYIDRVAQHTTPLGTHNPELAGAVSKRLTDAMAFLASKIPTPGGLDPLDPHSKPHLNDGEAASVARYGWYVERPSRFFDELERGKMTWEGAEVAQALMPGMFAEMQQRTADALTTMMAQGKKPPYEQRRRLGMLLNFAATPDQRPDMVSFLQANVVGSEIAAKAGPKPGRPLPTKTQPSALDRLEAR